MGVAGVEHVPLSTLASVRDESVAAVLLPSLAYLPLPPALAASSYSASAPTNAQPPTSSHVAITARCLVSVQLLCRGMRRCHDLMLAHSRRGADCPGPGPGNPRAASR